MFGLFKCKCPTKRLHVQKKETVTYGEWRTEVYGTERSIYVTYHLYCLRCSKRYDVEYVRFDEKGGKNG